jgi:hypothetical protein
MSLILAGYVFNPIQPLSDYVMNPEIEGLFGIFFLKHPEKKMADYGVLYISDTKEIYEDKTFPRTHKKYSCWVEKAGKEDNLYIGFCPTPGLMPKKQELIKHHLIYKYNPPCNK